MNKSVLILGGGGHASVVIEILRMTGAKIAGITDPEIKKGTLLHGDIPVIGSDDSIRQYSASEVLLVNGIGPIPKNHDRENLSKRFIKSGYEFLSAIHPSAYVSPSATIKSGAQVMAGAIIQSGCTIGIGSVVNTGSIVDHDSNVGDYSHLAPGTVICGGVQLGKGVFVGTGAVVIENLSLADNSLLAAGVTLRKDLKIGEVFYGI